MNWLFRVLLAVACLLAMCVESSESLEAILHTFENGIDVIEWITPKVVYVLSTGGLLKMSHDGGRSFSELPSLERVHLNEVYYSPAEKNVMLFVGANSFYVTKDYGKTTQEINWVIEDVRYHEKKGNLILGSRMSEGCKDHRTDQKCFKQLLYSDDHGYSWKHMLDYVVQYDFVPMSKIPKEHQTENLIFATAHANMHTDQPFGRWMHDVHLYESTDFFKTSKLVVQYGNRFSFGDSHYIFVAAVDKNDKEGEEVYLMVSKDYIRNFQEAVLPLDLSEHSYTIVDTSEGVVFLHVNHRPFGESAPSGHVYVSDWRGLVYSLSLPNNHRTGNGDCDFEKVYGLEGIYMANFLDSDGVEDIENEENFMEPKHGSSHKYREKTVISFDKGGQWSYLQPPKLDSAGKQWACSNEENCHLHLNGLTSERGFFYSQETAIGLIVGTGNVGAFLSPSLSATSTFLSRDAGLTWKEIRKGSYIYEFGDHGGLLVLANDVDSTNTLLYSYDEGNSFKEYKMSKKPFTVENIVIEPTASAKEFIVYGYRDGDGVAVYVNFAEMHERQCQGEGSPDTAKSDYESWTPSDGRTGGRCILGRSTNYLRRKQSSRCFNAAKLSHEITQQHCQCTWNDFECDYGYERKSIAEGLLQGGMGWATEGGWNPPSQFASEPCVLTKDKQHEQEGYAVDRHGHIKPSSSNKFILAETCEVSGLKRRVTKGYRRVPGDTCDGGEEFWDATWEHCPGAWKHMGIGKMIMVAMIILVVVVGCYVATFKGHLLGLTYTPLDMLVGLLDSLNLCECLSRVCDCLNRRSGSYQLVGQQGNIENPFDDTGLDADGVAQG